MPYTVDIFVDEHIDQAYRDQNRDNGKRTMDRDCCSRLAEDLGSVTPGDRATYYLAHF